MPPRVILVLSPVEGGACFAEEVESVASLAARTRFPIAAECNVTECPRDGCTAAEGCGVPMNWIVVHPSRNAPKTNWVAAEATCWSDNWQIWPGTRTTFL